MALEYTKLGDFNQVIEYYKNMLNFIKTLKPHAPIEFDFNACGVEYYRSTLNALGISIAQNFDYLERHLPDNIDEKILDELEHGGGHVENFGNLFSMIKEPFMKLMTDNGLTPFETLKQIRNALLHANYTLISSNPDYNDSFILEDFSKDYNAVHTSLDLKVGLHSPTMDGEMDFTPLSMILEDFYDKLRCKYAQRDTLDMYATNSKYISCKNAFFLNKYIQSLQHLRVRAIDKRPVGNKERILRNFPDSDEAMDYLESASGGCNYFEVLQLRDDHPELLKKRAYLRSYINYIGKENFALLDKLDHNLRDLLFEDIISYHFEGKSAVALSEIFMRKMASQTLSKYGKYSPDYKDHLFFATCSFEVPTLYANMLLGMTSYSCSYIKEVSNTQEIPLFEYHNLKGFDGVKPTIDTCDKKSIVPNCSAQEKKDKLSLLEQSLQTRIKSLSSKILKTKKNLRNLNDKNPRKAQMEAQFLESLETFQNDQNDTTQKISRVMIRKKDYDKDYTDYSEFFRHLRNSIAHGEFEINYDKAFKSGKLDKIEFTFRDFPEGDKKRITPEFEVTLSAKQLIRITNGIQEKTTTQLAKENQTEQILSTSISQILEVEHFMKDEPENNDSTQDLPNTGSFPDFND